MSGPETAHPVRLELVAVQAESAPEGVGQPVLTGQSLPESHIYVQSNASWDVFCRMQHWGTVGSFFYLPNILRQPDFRLKLCEHFFIISCLTLAWSSYGTCQFLYRPLNANEFLVLLDLWLSDSECGCYG